MTKNFQVILEASKRKALAAIALVEASAHELSPYDEKKNYTPKELEPYDAFCDRFIRAVEICIKFFRSYEYYLSAVSSDTFRDLLQTMEKQGVVSSVQIWMDMRDVRNRIVHDYVPSQIKEIYDLLMSGFTEELRLTKLKIEKIG